jgi:hypothetical protein
MERSQSGGVVPGLQFCLFVYYSVRNLFPIPAPKMLHLQPCSGQIPPLTGKVQGGKTFMTSLGLMEVEPGQLYGRAAGKTTIPSCGTWTFWLEGGQSRKCTVGRAGSWVGEASGDV